MKEGISQRDFRLTLKKVWIVRKKCERGLYIVVPVPRQDLAFQSDLL